MMFSTHFSLIELRSAVHIPFLRNVPHTWTGVVGLAGGMGGFILPIIFGALVDVTGVRSSAFMLMFGVVWVSLMWMYFTEVQPMGAELSRRHPEPFALHLIRERSSQWQQ
jgi:nitrate/nitrite transporter NarK